MKSFSKSLCFLMVGAALLLAGCPKKPARPDPNATVLGPNAGAGINPTGVGDMSAEQSGLEQKSGDKYDESNLERGILPTVYFDFDRSAIKPSERTKLQEAAKWFKDPANKDKHVLLEGHCDWRGTAEYNLGLGDRRANAVKDYLKSLGVDVNRLEIVSKGDLGAKENGTSEEMSKDRRVELAVMKL